MPKLCFIFLILVLFASTFAYAAEEKPNPTAFLTLSDIHFDPFIGCANAVPCPLIEKLRRASAEQWPAILAKNDTMMSKFRQDTRYPLLKSALNAAQQVAANEQAKFVLVLGDFLGHEYRDYYKKYSGDKSAVGYVSFVRKTFEFLTGELARSFPSINVYTVVGNNDSYEYDYVIRPHSIFFSDIARMWSGLIKNKNSATAMRQQFKSAGYYAIDMSAQPNLRLIVLNTNLFSYKAKGSNINKAAKDQLAWLDNELQNLKSNHKKAIIAMHIPDGVDIYASMHMRLFTLIQLWRKEYADRFQSDLKEYAPVIDGVFAGHIHYDWFHILTWGDKEIPIVGTPSISPIFGNNPGFKVYTYSPQIQQISNDATYSYQLNDDKSFNTKWCALRKIADANVKRCI